MARTVTLQPPTSRSGSTRSYWVKSLTPSGEESGSPPSNGDSEGPRFVEPFRFDAKQKNSLLQVLRRLRIGDTDGREIFMVAIAYDLAAYKAQAVDELPATTQPESPQAPPAQGLALEPMAAAITALCEQLDSLDGTSRERLVAELQRGDRFQRGYDERYLTELRCELDLLGQLCATPATASVQATTPTPTLSPQARHLITRLANAYNDCFEDPPTADPEGPFAQVVVQLCQIAAIELPTDADSLTQALEDL